MAARLILVVAVALAGCSAPMSSAEPRPSGQVAAADEPGQALANGSASVQPWDESGARPKLPPGLSERAAVELARVAAPQSAEFPATVALAGPGHNFLDRPDVPRDRWVWYILLSDLGLLGGSGTMVFLDYVDGRVYEVINLRG